MSNDTGGVEQAVATRVSSATGCMGYGVLEEESGERTGQPPASGENSPGQ